MIDPLDLLRTSKIWKYLETINSDYARRCEQFVIITAPILDSIKEYFPYYTEHNAIHSGNILKRMAEVMYEECLAPNTPNSISDVEAYLLICSSYGHDLGMTIFPGEQDALLKTLDIEVDDNWKENPVLTKYLREKHSVRGYNFLLDNSEKLKIPNPFIGHLQYMMDAHNKNTEEIKKDIYGKYVGNAAELNLPQLACILCIADALEFSNTRVKDGVIEEIKARLQVKFDKALTLSYQENVKHACIESALVVSSDGKVLVNGVFKEPDVLNLAHKTFDSIEGWLRDYLEIDDIYPRKRVRINNEIIYRNLKYAYGDFERLGIRMKKDNIINLISSNSLWGSRHEFVIKELLQNSVEACRYRKHNSSSADNYIPKIVVEIDEQQRTITIDDNGCGMSKDVILNNFLTVGNSRSVERAYLKGNYHSLARFGIGFWSCFTIAEKVHITTKDYTTLNDFGNSFEVNINPFKDYLLFKQDQHLSPGTIIKLFIKNEINLTEIPAKVSREIICSEIPITIRKTKKELTIPPLPILPDFEYFFGPKVKIAQKEGAKLFLWEASDNDAIFAMNLAYFERNDKISFLTTKNDSIRWVFYKNIPTDFHIISICGFVVNVHKYYTVFKRHAICSFVANINNPQGFTFDINRRTLLENDKLETFLEKLCLFLNQAYFEFLKHYNCLEPKEVYRLNFESRIGIQGGDIGSKKQTIKIIETFPELFVIKLCKIERGKDLSTCEIKYLRFEEVKKRNYKVVSYEGFFSEEARMHIDERHVDFVYNQVCFNSNFEGYYFHEVNPEINFLFEHAEDAYVYRMKFPTNLSIPLVVFSTSSIDWNKDFKNKHFDIRGRWGSGIKFKKVINSNFVFSYNGIYIDPNSILANDVSELLNSGEESKLSEIINLLKTAESGVADKAIEHYLQERW